MGYNPAAAVAYAHQWAFGRNPRYTDFSTMGGDCTNFISQCLYAGCGVMNYTRDVGWYYRSIHDRAAAWTGVEYLYRFLTRNQGRGPYGQRVPLDQVRPGDVIQLQLWEPRFGHSLMVVETGARPAPDNILITTHTLDSDRRPLSTYHYQDARGIQILGARG